MKKPLFVVTLCYLSIYSFAQSKLFYGLEFNINGAFLSTYQRSVVNGLNAFIIYEKCEVYTGFDVSTPNYIPKHVIGFEMGAKYHVYEQNRKSSFYFDLNYQSSKYGHGCTGDVNYYLKPVPYNACEIWYRIKSKILTVGLGYELFYRKWLSTSLSIGPGINWAKIKPTDYGITNNDKPENRTYLNYLIKASVRFTLH